MFGTRIGEVYVDSGQIMLIDPCYVLDDDYNPGGDPTGGPYDQVCRLTTGSLRYGQFNGGVATATYAGDGCYPVYADLDSDGQVMSVTIVFHDPNEDAEDLWDDEEEEEDDEEEDED